MSVLSRKKKQYVELGIMAALIVAQIGFLLYLFTGASIASDKVELAKLIATVDDAQRIFDRKESIRTTLDKTLKDLHSLRIHVPPAVDPYAWAYEYVSSRAATCGIHLGTVKEDDSEKTPKDKKERTPYYSVRLSMMCSYNQAVSFLRRLEDDNPLLLVSELKIESVSQNVNSHKINLRLRWPSDFVIDQGDDQ